MKDVAVIAAVRTPVGRFGGALSGLTAVELATVAVRAACRRAAVEPSEVDLVTLGHARQAGCGPNPSRQVAVRSGIPVTTPAYTINQACGSGLAAIHLAAAQIRMQEARIAVAAGTESMSRVPYLLEPVRFGHRLGHLPLVDAMYRDGFHDPLADMVMGRTAELLARRYSIGRQEQDRFALRSQMRCREATEAGRFREEITPVQTGKGIVEADEHPRPDTTLEKLARLPPVFQEDGTVTAGNASGINDAASAVVLMAGEVAARRGAEPLAWYAGGVAVGVEPEWMGLGPVRAVREWFRRRGGGSIEDFDLVELNEAFAVQVLACVRDLEIPEERLNVNGGAIALGHPIGCSGNRIAVTLLHEMRRRGARRGLATVCVSGGQGLASVFER